jgi:hypothetical protein
MTRSDNMTVSDCDLRYWHFADVSERTEDKANFAVASVEIRF